jgi:hypothetical protein
VLIKHTIEDVSSTGSMGLESRNAKVSAGKRRVLAGDTSSSTIEVVGLNESKMESNHER